MSSNSSTSPAMWVIIILIALGIGVYTLDNIGKSHACEERGGVYVREWAGWPTCIEGVHK